MRFVLPGDGVCGEIVHIRHGRPSASRPDGVKVLTVKVEAGQVNGEPLEPDSWVDLWCSMIDLEAFAERHDPQPGDTLSVLYGGSLEKASGRQRKAFAVGVDKQEVKTSTW
jgi:hypothetical protein